MNNILMNIEMTKAILDGSKIQTRRVLSKRQKIFFDMTRSLGELKEDLSDYNNEDWKFSKYQKDETIWVREPAVVTSLNSVNMTLTYHYIADDLIANENNKILIPERFIDMDRSGDIIENFDLIKPKWIKDLEGIPNGCIKEMARIFLKITNVRIEKLHDISLEECYSEGIDPFNVVEMLDGTEFKEFIVFKKLWNKTAPKGYKWEDNPYVFVYEFEKIK